MIDTVNKLQHTLAFGRLTIHERGVIHFTILHPWNFSVTAEDRIVKFCALVGPKSISLVMANFPPGGRAQGHVTS